MLEVRHSLISVCRARRPQTPGIWPPPPSECIPLFHVPRHAPHWATFGRRSSTILPYLGAHGWCPDVWWVRVCVCVCGWRYTGNLPAAAISRREEREEIIMYSKGALQSPIQWHAIPSRCFITYSFTIIGRHFCPFTSVYTHNSPP